MRIWWRRPDAILQSGEADLATQLEAILHSVWQAEADWRLSDRIDLAVRRQSATGERG